MINRRELMQGMMVGPLLAAGTSTMATAANLLGTTGSPFRLDALQEMVSEQFYARGDTTSLGLELVEVIEYSGKVPQPTLEQFTAVFQGSSADAPEGLYKLSSTVAGRRFNGTIFLQPGKEVAGGGSYYKSTCCNFRRL